MDLRYRQKGSSPQRQTSQPSVIATAPPGFVFSYPHHMAKMMGITQVAIGVLCALLNAPLSTEKFRFDVLFGYVGTGIWCGAIFAICGFFTFLSGKNRTSGLITATMVLSIVSACFAAALVSMGSVTLAISDTENIDTVKEKHAKIGHGLGISLTVLGGIEGILAVIMSALCCGAVCCGKDDKQVGVEYVQKSDGTYVAVNTVTMDATPGGSLLYQGTTTIGVPKPNDDEK